MLALTLAVSLQLGAADVRPEAWVVVTRRSGVARPQALDFARTLSQMLSERGVPAPTPVDDATSCAAKVPCLVELAQKKGVAVLIAVEAGSALDDVVLHVEALSVDEFGKKLATFDFTGPANDFQVNLKEKVEEFFAPAVRNVLGLGKAVAKSDPPPKVEETKPPPPVEAKPPPPEETKPPPAAVVAAKPEKGFSTLNFVGIGAAAVGAVLLVTAMAFGINTMNLEGKRNAACPRDLPCHDPMAFDLYNAARSSQGLGVGMLITGAIAAAAGAALFFIDFGADSPATVTPAASSDGMGLTLSGRF